MLFADGATSSIREPGDVSDLPERRIDDSEPRTDQLLVIEISDQIKGAGAEFAHDWDQIAGGNGGNDRRVLARRSASYP